MSDIMNNSQAWKKKKMKIRNLPIREDNPWPVTLTWLQWQGEKVLKREQGNPCWW